MALPVLAPEFQGRTPVGGEEVQHTLLSKTLARRGYEVSLVVADYGQPDGAVWDGVKTHRAQRLDGGLPILRFLHPRLTQTWAALARANADIYYVSCAGALLGQVAAYCRMHGKRLVFRTASDSDCEPGALLVRYARDRHLYHYGLRRADAVLVQSVRQQTALRRNYGRSSEVAGMLVDRPDILQPYEARNIDVLWLANLRPLKRPNWAPELAARLPGVRMHMAGGADSSNPGVYESVRQEAGSLPNLVFHGAVPYKEAGRLYDAARIFVNTSEIEGFPNSFLQSWVRGTPVVTTFDPDGLIDGEGLGVVVGSVGEMAAAVNQLLINRAEWQRLSHRCLRFMGERYGDEQVLTPYVKTFQGLAA